MGQLFMAIGNFASFSWKTVLMRTILCLKRVRQPELCKAHRPAYNLVLQVLLAHGADPDVVTKPGMAIGCFMRDAFTKGEHNCTGLLLLLMWKLFRC